MVQIGDININLSEAALNSIEASDLNALSSYDTLTQMKETWQGFHNIDPAGNLVRPAFQMTEKIFVNNIPHLKLIISNYEKKKSEYRTARGKLSRNNIDFILIPFVEFMISEQFILKLPDGFVKHLLNYLVTPYMASTSLGVARPLIWKVKVFNDLFFFLSKGISALKRKIRYLKYKLRVLNQPNSPFLDMPDDINQNILSYLKFRRI